MTHQMLLNYLGQVNVQVPDTWRAGYYYDHLRATRTFFFHTLNAGAPGGLGLAAYTFCRNALRNPALLNTMCGVMDLNLAPAVNADLQWEFAHGHGPNDGNEAWTYEDYFNEMLFNVNYNANVARFRGDYLISDHALTQIRANFENNIRSCCERVYADRVLLRDFYNDLYDNTLVIDSLTEIKSSGSDFHKGGQQVLLLTFAIRHRKGGAQNDITDQLRVVYKPGDLEADCLLVGDSDAVNNVIPDFMEESLVEIYNRILDDEVLDGLDLFTYRILPRNYNSLHGNTLPLPIRNAYGYVQFLNNDLVWGNKERWGYYPNASSDYVIFKSESLNNIVHQFYLRAGTWCAVASTFSNIDLHVENFRVLERNPYPIDLEISLATAVDDVGSTKLVGTDGGITGFSVTSQKYRWDITDRNVAGRVRIVRVDETETYQNRLWKALPGRTTELIPVAGSSVLEGFFDGMHVLQQAQIDGAFDDWLTRLNNNVVVRYLTLATPKVRAVLQGLIISYQQGPNGRGATYANGLDYVQMVRRTLEYEDFVNQQQDHPDLLPDFIGLVDNESRPDYLSLDIPVFYHLINPGNADIVNSRGLRVDVPVTVRIFDQNNPPQPYNAPCRALVNGRTTFLPGDPTATIVEADQLIPLANQDTFRTRYNLLKDSMLPGLGLNAVPDDVRYLIAID